MTRVRFKIGAYEFEIVGPRVWVDKMQRRLVRWVRRQARKELLR